MWTNPRIYLSLTTPPPPLKLKKNLHFSGNKVLEDGPPLLLYENVFNLNKIVLFYKYFFFSFKNIFLFLFIDLKKIYTKNIIFVLMASLTFSL